MECKAEITFYLLDKDELTNKVHFKDPENVIPEMVEATKILCTNSAEAIARAMAKLVALTYFSKFSESGLDQNFLVNKMQELTNFIAILHQEIDSIYEQTKSNKQLEPTIQN